MSTNANTGDRIKISPATSGVSALPPNVSLFYEITESLSDVAPSTSSDVLELAVPNGQLVTSTTFTVEVISENYDSSAVATPQVDGASMTQSQLQYPGTSTDSVQVWSLDVTLTADQLNTMTITGGPSPITLNVTHSGDLTSAFVTSAAQARAALGDSANDEVVFNYPEADLIGNVLSAVAWPTAKSSYTTVRAGTGSIALPNDTANGDTGYDVSLPADYLFRIQGAAIGSATDDGGGGTMVQLGDSAGVWFDGCTFTQHYNITDYPNSYDAPYSGAIVQGEMNHTSYPKTRTGGRDCLFTDCTWEDWGFKGCSVRDILVRDCIFINTRGDINNNGRLILNNRLVDPAPMWTFYGYEDQNGNRISYVVNPDLTPSDEDEDGNDVSVNNVPPLDLAGLAATDPTHMDIYQCSTQSADPLDNTAGGSYVIGVIVESTTARGFDGQSILTSGSNPAENYVDGLIIDNLILSGTRTNNDLLTQFGQGVINARISNSDFNGQGIVVRRDLDSPFESGENVYFTNLSASEYKYSSSSTTVFNFDGDVNAGDDWAQVINEGKEASESDINVSGIVVDNPPPALGTFTGSSTGSQLYKVNRVVNNTQGENWGGVPSNWGDTVNEVKVRDDGDIRITFSSSMVDVVRSPYENLTLNVAGQSISLAGLSKVTDTVWEWADVTTVVDGGWGVNPTFTIS